MSENKLHLIPQLGWFSGVGDLWPLPIFPIYWLLGTSCSIWWTVHHPPYESTFIGIWGSGPHRRNPTSSSPHAPVGSFPDTPTGVSGPAATNTLQIPNSAMFTPDP